MTIEAFIPRASVGTEKPCSGFFVKNGGVKIHWNNRGALEPFFYAALEKVRRGEYREDAVRVGDCEQLLHGGYVVKLTEAELES